MRLLKRFPWIFRELDKRLVELGKVGFFKVEFRLYLRFDFVQAVCFKRWSIQVFGESGGDWGEGAGSGSCWSLIRRRHCDLLQFRPRLFVDAPTDVELVGALITAEVVIVHPCGCDCYPLRVVIVCTVIKVDRLVEEGLRWEHVDVPVDKGGALVLSYTRSPFKDWRIMRVDEKGVKRGGCGGRGEWGGSAMRSNWLNPWFLLLRIFCL
jgi:hypothetical protein